MEIPEDYTYFENTDLTTITEFHSENKTDFGFTKKNPLPQIISCKLFPEFKQINISLLSSFSKDNKELIRLVEQKAKSIGYTYLSVLLISNNNTIMNWYTSLGFVIISEKYFPAGNMIAYSMQKVIH